MLLEVIDNLCHVSNVLLSLVKKQAEIIAQEDIAKDIKDELDKELSSIEEELDLIEYKIRRRI